MDKAEARKIGFWIILVLPIFAWFGAVKATHRLVTGHAFHSLRVAAGDTLDSIALMAAPVVGLIIAILLAWLLVRFSGTEFAGARFTVFLRGTKVVSINRLIQITNNKKHQQVSVAGVPMPLRVENLHTMIGGSIGAGKTVVIRGMVYGALKRGDRFIMADPNGDMLAKFYKPGDVILNPYDERTQGWSIFNEIRAEYDYNRFALSVVPRGQTKEAEEWASYGRLLLREVMRQLQVMRGGNVRMSEVMRWTNIEDPKRLHEFLKGTMAESLFVGSDKALAGARFILSDKLPEHVTMPEGAFSLRNWLDDPKGGNLYITWREDMAPAMRPLISAWVDVLCTSILSMPENEDRRIWMFLDELASLEKLASLEAALTKGRKHGLRVVAGLQSTAQLDNIYGRDEAQIIRACFRSLVVLGGAKTDPKTQEDLSQSLGDHEVEREQKSRSGGMNGGTNTATRHERERVVMPSEIASLPELTGYVAFAGNYPIARFKLDILKFKNRVPSFTEKSIGQFGDDVAPEAEAVDQPSDPRMASGRATPLPVASHA